MWCIEMTQVHLFKAWFLYESRTLILKCISVPNLVVRFLKGFHGWKQNVVCRLPFLSLPESGLPNESDKLQSRGKGKVVGFNRRGKLACTHKSILGSDSTPICGPFKATVRDRCEMCGNFLIMANFPEWRGYGPAGKLWASSVCRFGKGVGHPLKCTQMCPFASLF